MVFLPIFVSGAQSMATRNINLTDHLHQFVDEEVQTGRYRNASEVLRAGLRLLEQQRREEQEKLALLRSLATAAFDQLDQGQGIELRSERQLTNLVHHISRRATGRAKHSRRGT
jgi:antitoxin ParD1/3/4